MNKNLLFTCLCCFLLAFQNTYAQPADAEVSTFASPLTTDFCPAQLPVSIDIYNNDIVDITEVVLNWSINSVAQSPVTWSGLLSAGNIATVQLDPSYDFQTGTSYFIEVTISTVNTQPDPNGLNDYNSSTFNAYFVATPQFYWDGCALECTNCYSWVGDYDSVVWILNGAPDPASIDTAYYTPSQNGTYTVIGYSWGTACEATTDSVIAVTATTHGITASGSTELCEGDSVSLVFSASVPVTFTWTPGGSSADSIYASATGWYYVNGTYGFGCSLSDSIEVIVHPLPVVTIGIAGDTLYSDFSGQQQWYFEGSPIGGATDSFYVASMEGNYYVIADDGNGCTATSNTILITGGISLAVADEIILYPNPAVDMINIKFKSVPENFGIRIFDAVGKIVLEDEISSDKTIDISYFKRGMYQVVFTGNGKSFTRTLVKAD